MKDRRDVGDLGAILSFLRVLRGWNQGELGAAAGLPQSAISDIERGKRLPSPAVRDRLLAALELPPALVEGADRLRSPGPRTRRCSRCGRPPVRRLP